MNLNQAPAGQRARRKGCPGSCQGGRSWPWQFLGLFLLVAVMGGPARLAGGAYQETNPSAKVQNAWLTASVSVVDTTASASPTITLCSRLT